MAYTKTNITEAAPSWEAEGIEPPDTLKESGFTAGYKPPAAFFNWFWFLVSALLGKLKDVVNNIQDYLNGKNLYVYNDAGEISSINSVNGAVSQYSSSPDPRVFAFTPTGSLLSYLRSALGITVITRVLLDCKNVIMYLPEQGVSLYRDSNNTWKKVEVKGAYISDGSITPAKVSFNYATYASGGTVSNMPDLENLYQTHLATDLTNNSVTHIYFSVGSTGSLRSITFNADEGVLNCRTATVVFDNGMIFKRAVNEASWTNRRTVYAGDIGEGVITENHLSDSLKSALGL